MAQVAVTIIAPEDPLLAFYRLIAAITRVSDVALHLLVLHPAHAAELRPIYDALNLHFLVTNVPFEQPFILFVFLP